MKLNIDPEAIIENAHALAEIAESFKQDLDNLYWKYGLPEYERLMLDDYMHKYKVDALGLGEEEYNRYAEISANYHALNQPYSRYNFERRPKYEDVDEMEKYPDRYDDTINECCERWFNIDRETAQKVSSIMNKIDKKAIYHENNIKEHYYGDLAGQLGMDIETKEAYIKKAMEELEKKRAACVEAMNSNNYWGLKSKNEREEEQKENQGPRL